MKRFYLEHENGHWLVIDRETNDCISSYTNHGAAQRDCDLSNQPCESEAHYAAQYAYACGYHD